MGGEKKATDIHSGRRRSSLVTTNTEENSPTIVNAENRIHSILQARQSRQRRRSDICKSLDNASPMIEKHSRKSFSGLPDELENITLPLNDVDSPEALEKEGVRRRRRSLGSLRRSDVSRDHRIRMMKGLDSSKPAEKKNNDTGSFLSPFTPKSPMKRIASANALRNKLRQRLQGVNYCDLNESNHSDSDTEVKIKPTFYDSDEDDCTADESDEFMEPPKSPKSSRKGASNRSKSRQRSRSKSSKKTSKKDLDVEGEESLKKTRSKSKNRIRSKSKSKQKRRSSVGRTEAEEDSTSFTRRSQRRPKNEEASIVSESSDVECSSEFLSSHSFKSIGSVPKSPRSSPKSPYDRKGRRRLSRNPLDTSNSSTESYSTSPGSLKGKKRTKTKKPSLEKCGEEDTSLSGFLLESERKNRTLHNDDLSHVTEEKSNASSQPPKFLQFDPTSGNHVRSVDQNKAKITSGSINGLHGMTPKLEIAEMTGLPTFEKVFTGDSTSTGATEESLSGSSHHDPNNFFATIPATPKRISRRSASMVSPVTQSFQTPGEDPFEGCNQNAQWNFGEANSAHGSRSIGNVGKNLLFNKKGDKPTRRSSMGSAFPARRNSLGSMVGLRGRFKSRDFEDGEALLATM